MIRMSKIALVVFVGLQGLFYGLNNIVNFKQAISFVTGVLSEEESHCSTNQERRCQSGNQCSPSSFGFVWCRGS